MRVVVAGGQSAHGGKTAHTQGGDGGLRTTSDHDIGIAVFDQSTGLANAVQTRGASRDHGQVGALEATADGHMARDHVDDGGRHKKRGNAPRTAGHQFGMGVFDQWQPTDARTNHATDAGGLFFTQSLPSGQTGIGHRLQSRNDAKVDETVHPARFFGADVLVQVQVADLTGDLAREGFGVEFAIQTDARTTRQ